MNFDTIFIISSLLYAAVIVIVFLLGYKTGQRDENQDSREVLTMLRSVVDAAEGDLHESCDQLLMDARVLIAEREGSITSDPPRICTSLGRFLMYRGGEWIELPGREVRSI